METLTAAAVATAKQVPLCVDLDGTLVKCDTLYDSCLHAARRHPSLLAKMPFWLLRGKSGFKAALAQYVQPSASHLPYNESLLAFLKQEYDLGRELYLVTGADARIAIEVASHLGIFAGIVSSDGTVNLTGNNKLAALQKQFGPTGFDYIGNSAADIPALAHARIAMLANPHRSALVKARLKQIPIAQVFNGQRRTSVALFSAIRVRQWPKNLLIFLPLFLAHQTDNGHMLLKGLIAFFAFSFVASAGYILNDLLDIEVDRKHPRKCRRPFAAGDLSPVSGLFLVLSLLVASVGLVTLQPPHFLIWLALYFATTVSYSILLKKIALVDVLVLAGLYTVRLICGSIATGAPLSAWMESFALFFFLSLAIVKRYSELHALRLKHAIPQNDRGYRIDDIEQMRSFGTASSYAAVVVFVLYVNSPEIQRLYRHPHLLWLITPLIVYWINRVWLLAHRGELDEDPVIFAVTDRVSLLIGLLSAAIVVLGAR
ncbi:MAG TPA: UbiA family prenyltransferase [Terriglobales bacterium]|nr:UbiA family prenyltransferase [Terriglobales bacterium]